MPTSPAEPQPHDAVPSPAAGAVAGTVGAAVALATGELLSALLDVTPSPVLAIGGEFVDRFAASLKTLAVAVFGTNDKPALVVGTVAVALLLGSAVGVLARRRPWLPPVVLGGFAAVGAAAQVTDPQGAGAFAWVVALASTVAGATTIAFLLRRAPQRTVHAASSVAGITRSDDLPDPAAGVGRRRFVGLAAVFVAGAASAAALGRAIQQSEVVSVAAQRMKIRAPKRRRSVPPQPFSVPGVSPYITSIDAFYRIDTALSTPQVNVDEWRLQVGGLVESPFELTYDELLALPSVEEVVTLQCVSNEVGDDLVGNARWQGVPLADLLARAGVKAGAEQVFSRSVDGWTAGFPSELVDDGRVAMVAYAMNGEPLPVPHGFPARLVVSGVYGYVSATKWLETIELTPWEGTDGYWISRGWSKEGAIKLASRIDVPRRGAEVPAGEVTLGGVAWRPSVGVAAVEVSIDEGPWEQADLGAASSEHTWVQWRHRADLAPGSHAARVRAIDRDGRTQTAVVRPPQPDGATGLHEVTFTVENA